MDEGASSFLDFSSVTCTHGTMAFTRRSLPPVVCGACGGACTQNQASSPVYRVTFKSNKVATSHPDAATSKPMSRYPATDCNTAGNVQPRQMAMNGAIYFQLPFPLCACRHVAAAIWDLRP